MEFSLKLTAEEVQIVGKGLEELPYRVVAALMVNINAQLAKQQNQQQPTSDEKSNG